MSELIYLYRVLYIYWSVAFLKQIVHIKKKEAYYQELYILIIEFINVVNLAEW
jgi:hypothetical protein